MQQAGWEHAGLQSRDTQEAGRQQMGWQEEVGTQHVGRHTGRQRRDTEEEGLQLTLEQGLGWQHKEAEQREDSQQTGLQLTGSQQACWQGEEVQQEGWQLDCWQHEAGQELLQAGWQQGLDSQLTGAQRRVRRGTGAQQLGAQQGGSQQLSGQS